MLRRARRASLALVLPAALAIGLGASVFAAPNHDHKTTICHVAGSRYVKIMVANASLPAHLGHGDVMPDEYGDCP
jgi:hypothetical protein